MILQDFFIKNVKTLKKIVIRDMKSKVSNKKTDFKLAFRLLGDDWISFPVFRIHIDNIFIAGRRHSPELLVY